MNFFFFLNSIHALEKLRKLVEEQEEREKFRESFLRSFEQTHKIAEGKKY